MKKIYQAPEILETTIVVESIVAGSGGQGTLNTDHQVSGGSGGGGRAGKEQNTGGWDNIWGN